MGFLPFGNKFLLIQKKYDELNVNFESGSRKINNGEYAKKMHPIKFGGAFEKVCCIGKKE